MAEAIDEAKTIQQEESRMSWENTHISGEGRESWDRTLRRYCYQNRTPQRVQNTAKSYSMKNQNDKIIEAFGKMTSSLQ